MIVWYVNDIVDWREYRDVGNVNVCGCVMNENASGTYYESPVYTLPAKNDFRDGTKRRNKKKKGSAPLSNHIQWQREAKNYSTQRTAKMKNKK
jgi:hypothetical protein